MCDGFQSRSVAAFLFCGLALVLLLEKTASAIEEVPVEVHAEEPEIEEPEVIEYTSGEKKIMEQFEQFDFQYTGGKYHDETFYYRLYVPPNLVEGKKYPLLVWLLWGKGRAGRDTGRHPLHLIHGLEHWEETKGAFPAFILVPRAPADRSWLDGEDPLTIARGMLESTVKNYPIDEDAISLTGVSLGGSACWEMGMRYPDLFSAIAPMGSGGGDLSRVQNITEIPIWAFHNAHDAETPIQGVRDTVDALQAIDGKVILTCPVALSHDTWTVATTEHDVFSWLVARRRGDWMWRPQEAHQEWLLERVAPIVVGIGVVTLVLFASAGEKKRRKKLSVQKSGQEPTPELH